MLETFITVALMLGAPKNGESIRVEPPIVEQVKNITAIDANNLNSNSEYRVLHLPNHTILIVGQDQNGSGK